MGSTNRNRKPAMTRMIFVNLPVRDLAASIRFYTALGFTINPGFSDDSGACMVWSDTIHVMLVTHAKWQTFTDRPIPDRGTSEVSLAITLDSRAEVDAMMDAAAANGGAVDVNPVQDHSFMYGRDLADPDDHIWGPFWMDPAAMPPSA